MFTPIEMILRDANSHRNDLINLNAGNTGLPVSQLQSMSTEALVQLVLEWSRIADGKTYQGNGTFDRPLLFDTPRKTLEPDDSYYVHTAIHLNPRREMQFNALENPRTKSVKISGVMLVFDKGEAYRKQMAYHGDDVRDLKTLEIYADQVIVRVHLRFPATDVTIYARQLIFEGENACIDTTPIGFGNVKAISPKRGEYGPEDAKGPTYVAKDGKNGEKAGDIHLYVLEIVKQGGKKDTKRFICQGSPGQAAEDGGKKKYAPKKPNQPADKPDLSPVTKAEIRHQLEQLTALEEKRESWWRWPGGSDTGGVDSLDKINTHNDALGNNKVVSLSLILHNAAAYDCRATRVYFPGRDTIRTTGCEFLVPIGVFPNPARIACVEAEVKKYREGDDPGRQRPGDGPDAYPSGKPGDGGNGGNIVSHLFSAPVDSDICDNRAGDAGPATEPIPGGAAGSPNPAYWAKIYAIKKTPPVEYKENPTIELADVSAAKGMDAPGKQGRPGVAGKLTSDADSTWMSWLRPEALVGICRYARDVYRNGHREKAGAMLRPYYYALLYKKDELPAALLGHFTDITSIRANLINNLDYYGNPPGWLPRLDAGANYDIWHLYSENSAQILYFAEKMERDWDRISDEQEAITQVGNALKAEWDATAGLLENSYRDLKTAKQAMDDVQKELEAQEEKVNKLRLQVKAETANKLVEQQVFSGVMKIVGGLAQSIPVGQPFLGLAGKTLDLAGDFDLNNPDASTQLGTFFKGLSKETAAFLEENEDLFVERSSDSLPKPPGTVAKLKLKAQLKAVKSAIEDLDTKVEKSKEPDETETSKWEAIVKEKEAPIKTRIRELETEIAELRKTAPTSQQLRDKVDELGPLAGLAGELNEARRMRLARAKSKLYAALQEIEKKKSAIATAKQAAQVRESLLTRAEELEKTQEATAITAAQYEEDVADTEKKTKSLLKNLGGLSNGISSIGRGIVALTRPVDEKAVDALIEQTLQSSKYKDEYLTLLGEVKAINARKAQAASLFGYHQQLISTCTGQLASAAVQLNALSNQRQVADDVLDPGMKEYLRDMQTRAKENLLWSQYLFIKAWQYEHLTDVSSHFYDMEQWAERFRAFELKKARFKFDSNNTDKLPEYNDTYEDRKKLANTFLEEKDFTEIGELVRKANVLDLVKPVLNERQHHPQMKTNTQKCELNEGQLKKLREEGRVSFNFVRDFKLLSFHDVKAKISDIQLEVFEIESQERSLSLAIEFVHSGTSVLLGVDKKYYKFQKGPEDDPISWGFVYRHSDYLRLKDEEDDEVWTFVGEGPIQKDHAATEAVSKVIKEELDGESNYSEYHPSFFSDITLWINRKQHYEKESYKELLAKLGKVKKVQFAVHYLWK